MFGRFFKKLANETNSVFKKKKLRLKMNPPYFA